jgi:hypothetical protein
LRVGLENPFTAFTAQEGPEIKEGAAYDGQIET